MGNQNCCFTITACTFFSPEGNCEARISTKYIKWIFRKAVFHERRQILTLLCNNWLGYLLPLGWNVLLHSCNHCPNHQSHAHESHVYLVLSLEFCPMEKKNLVTVKNAFKFGKPTYDLYVPNFCFNDELSQIQSFLSHLQKIAESLFPFF